jgi:hypothetical protein
MAQFTFRSTIVNPCLYLPIWNLTRLPSHRQTALFNVFRPWFARLRQFRSRLSSVTFRFSLDYLSQQLISVAINSAAFRFRRPSLPQRSISPAIIVHENLFQPGLESRESNSASIGCVTFPLFVFEWRFLIWKNDNIIMGHGSHWFLMIIKIHKNLVHIIIHIAPIIEFVIVGWLHQIRCGSKIIIGVNQQWFFTGFEFA